MLGIEESMRLYVVQTFQRRSTLTNLKSHQFPL